MASANKTIQEAVQLLNIPYDKKKKFAYGVFRGYTIVISGVPSNEKEVNIYLCASCNGEPIKENYLQSSKMPQKVSVKVGRYEINLNITLKGKKAQDVDTVVQAVTAAIDSLNTAGCANCDVRGVIGETSVYSIKGNKALFTEESAEQMRHTINHAAEEYAQLKENPFLGIIGALLGSLVGALLIFLIARLGRISVLGSLVMGVAVAFGYKKLGKKITMVSGVVCAIIAIAMNYLTFRMDATLTVYNAVQGTMLEMSFGDCFMNVKELYRLAGAVSTYYKNLWLMMITGVVGAFAPILLAYSDEKTQFEFYKY